MNVLITCASRRVALVNHFILNGDRVIAIDCDQYSPAMRFASEFYIVHLVNELEYSLETEKIIKDRDINLIIPTLDDELEFWAEKKKHYESKGVWVSISPAGTIKTCLDKIELDLFFYNNFFNNRINARLIYPSNGNHKYPYMIKPIRGSGTKGVHIINNYKDKTYFETKDDYRLDKNCFFQEYLEGPEFTVDCFFSRQHRLISYVPRYREKIRAGVSDRGRTFKSPELEKLILQISEKLPFEGSVNMQGKITDNGIKFFEINPRFSGGIQLSLAAGYNPAELLSREMQGEILEPDLGNFKENIVMMSYEESIFLDERKDFS